LVLRGTGGAGRLVGFVAGAFFFLFGSILLWTLWPEPTTLGKALMIAAPVLAGAVAFAFSATRLGLREIVVDDSGVRFRVRGTMRWEIRWRDIAAIESIPAPFRHSPAGILITTENGVRRVDTFNDFGPREQMRKAFREMAQRTAGPSVKVMDALGWTKGPGPGKENR
jgi:hypothetical protein